LRLRSGRRSFAWRSTDHVLAVSPFSTSVAAATTAA
jgi:hypothetical protein